MTKNGRPVAKLVPLDTPATTLGTVTLLADTDVADLTPMIAFAAGQLNAGRVSELFADVRRQRESFFYWMLSIHCRYIMWYD